MKQLVAALCVVFLPALALAQTSKLAVLPTQVDRSATGMVPELFDEVVLTAVQDATTHEVIGADDISALLGFEAEKDLLGCTETSCLVDIGGALGVDRLVVIKIAKVGDEWVSTTKIINTSTTTVEARSSDFIPGGVKALIQAMPEIMRRLFAGGGTAQVIEKTPSAPAPSTPQPVTETGSLTVNTKPGGAECALGGTPGGNTPCRFESLKAGRYELALKKEFYADKTVTVYVYANVDTPISYTLKAKPVKIDLQVEPKDAEILVNERPMGKSLNLNPGSYKLLVTRDDYQDVSQTLKVAAGPSQSLNFKLVPGSSSDQMASWNQRLLWGLIFTGVTVITGALWAWQGLEAQGAADRLPGISVNSPDVDSTIKAGSDAALVSDVMMSATAATGVIATALLVSLAF